MFDRKLVVPVLLLFITLPTACIAPLPQAVTGAGQDTLFQTSTLSKLSAGQFDGTLTIGELKQHGDFGLGTYNALDGEMVVLDGQVYQARDDGLATVADDATQTPFAAVTNFSPDLTVAISTTVDCPQLQTAIDNALPTLDAPYAIKISGEFSTLTVRSPHKSSPPYPTLTEALADQVLFESQIYGVKLYALPSPHIVKEPTQRATTYT